MPALTDLPLTNAATLIIGLLLLVLGRRLFWLFVGAVGFFAGLTIAGRLFQDQSNLVVLVLALIAGVIGALLAVLVQRFALGLAGFLAGGYLATNLLALTSFDSNTYAWIAFIVGGVIGAALISLLFDWAIILLSSLSGATLVVNSFQIRSEIEAVIFIVLVIAGIWIQARGSHSST